MKIKVIVKEYLNILHTFHIHRQIIYASCRELLQDLGRKCDNILSFY
jgi:hypothetical protein